MDTCVHNHKNHNCVNWKKIEKVLNGVDGTDEKCKNNREKIMEDKLKQRNRYRFPKHETIDQLENVFLFDLETHNDQEFAEAYTAGIYNVHRIRDKWDRISTVEEKETERKCFNKGMV